MVQSCIFLYKKLLPSAYNFVYKKFGQFWDFCTKNGLLLNQAQKRFNIVQTSSSSQAISDQ